MAIKYYNIKEKPEMSGFAVKVNTEHHMKKTVEDFSETEFCFEKIREDENYAHFKLIEGDYSILRDKTADATEVGANQTILNRGKGIIAKVCIDNLGNMRLYDKKKKLLLNKISKSKAYSIKRDAQNWRMLQSWV